MAPRPFELARVAVEAERLRWRRLIAAQIRRAVCFGVAAMFAMMLLGMLHVLIYLALRQYTALGPFLSALILCAIDLIGALAAYGVGASAADDSVAQEAKLVREQAVMQLRKSMATAAILRRLMPGVLALLLRRRK